MENILITLLNRSLIVSVIIPILLLIRLCLKKAPKWISCLLWIIAGVRLVSPVTPESIVSLIPSIAPLSPSPMTDHSPQIQIGSGLINSEKNPILQDSFSTSLTSDVLFTHLELLSVIWLIGVAAMIAYAVISILLLRRRMGATMGLSGEKNIFLADGVPTPFILGILRPRIYLPSDLLEERIPHILAHERAHLRRLDHISKPFGYAVLSLYWFHPLVWVAYLMLCHDIELACDEYVIREMTLSERKHYAETLLSCSSSRHRIAACPVAFGESGIKTRIRSVLDYKKPVTWVVFISLIICMILGVVFLTDQPKATDTDVISGLLSTWRNRTDSPDLSMPTIALYENGRFHFHYSMFSSEMCIGVYQIEGEHLILRSEMGGVYTFLQSSERVYVFDATNSTPIPTYRYGENGPVLPPVSDGMEFELEYDASDPASRYHPDGSDRTKIIALKRTNE